MAALFAGHDSSGGIVDGPAEINFFSQLIYANCLHVICAGWLLVDSVTGTSARPMIDQIDGVRGRLVALVV